MAAGGGGFPTQEWDDYRTSADAHLNLTDQVKAGLHTVGVSFVGKSWEQEGMLQPPLREYGATVTEITDTTSKPEGPGVESVTIDGPYNPLGRVRRRAGSGSSCAVRRRPRRSRVRQADSRHARAAGVPAAGDRQGRRAAAGVLRGRAAPRGASRAASSRRSSACSSIRSSCSGSSRAPAESRRQRCSHLSDIELASRLSFFLWSSIPDDELLELAERGPPEGSGRARAAGAADAGRSRARRRSSTISSGSGCSCADVEAQAPDPNVFPEFDENLREAFMRRKPSSSSRASCAKTAA